MPAKKEKKPVSGKEIASKDPKWHQLHWVLSETGDHLLRSVLERKDIPLDVKDILKGVLVLREAKELFYAEGNCVTPFSAMMWAEELSKWANLNTPLVEVDARLVGQDN